MVVDQAQNNRKPLLARSSIVAACLVILIGVAITALVYSYIREQMLATQRSEFEVQASIHASEVASAIQHRMTQISSIGHLFSASNWVDRAEYEHLIELVYGQFPDHRRVSWIQIVTTENYPNLLQSYQNQHGADFRFFDLDLSSNTTNEAKPNDNKPLLAVGYSYPATELNHLVGRNLHEGMPIFEHIAPAYRGEAPYVSGFREALPPADYPFFIIAVPVHDLEGNLIGVVISSNSLTGLFTSLIERFPRTDFQYRLTAHDGSAFQYPEKTLQLSSALEQNTTYGIVPIEIAGNQWRLAISPAHASAGFNAPLLNGFALLGLIVTLLLAHVTRLNILQTQALAKQVKERTQDLELALEKANAAAEAKGQFLSNMSHEMRTPLNGIIGLTELCLRRDVDEVIENYLNKVHSSADHLMRLINDILDFNKIDGGHVQLESHPFSLLTVVELIRSNFEDQCRKKALSFDIQLDASTPLDLNGDEMRISQVLMNLCANAVKFTNQGFVTVQISPVQISKDLIELEFQVKDSGIGIDSVAQSKLFQEFTQADSSMTRKFGGTGLGLAISRKICELMGGSLTVTSTPGQGSTFIARMQIKPDETITETTETQSNADKAEMQTAALAGRKVLVAEDNAVNQMLVEDLLVDCGVSVTMADNGQDAIDHLKANHAFDLVLMDINMPVKDGVTATRFIREQLHLTGLPIIALTANVNAEDVESYLACGMNDHISKPFHMEEFVRKLAQNLKS
ncbi:MAG: ATP-binding protein [Pseudomonadales bacterium]